MCANPRSVQKIRQHLALAQGGGPGTTMPVRPWMVHMAPSEVLPRLTCKVLQRLNHPVQNLVQCRGFSRTCFSFLLNPGVANVVESASLSRLCFKVHQLPCLDRVQYRGSSRKFYSFLVNPGLGGVLESRRGSHGFDKKLLNKDVSFSFQSRDLWTSRSSSEVQNVAQHRRLSEGLNTIRWNADVKLLLQPRGFARGSSGRAGLLLMANVTKRNFTEAYEQLKGHLELADFVAIDLEMTGVESTLWRRNFELDSCDTRYQNLKHSAEKFAVWQCGVCPFKWDEATNKFIAFPYNFFIFPRNELELNMPSRGFFAQTTSLEFLAKHRFDFNTCVYDGVSFLSPAQEAAARVQLGLVPGTDQKTQKPAGEPEIPLTKTGDVVFVERIRARVGKWRSELLNTRKKWQYTEPPANDPVRNPILASSSSKTLTQELNPENDTAVGAVLGSLRPALVLDVMSTYQSRLVTQVLQKHYHDLVGLVKEKGTTGDRSQVRVIYTSSKEDKIQLLQETAEEERRALETRVSEAVGFRKVLDAIAESGIPVIGHNCILDMTHIHSKFMGPLPPTVGQFATSLQRRFPCLVDTKYLLRAEPTLRGVLANRSTSLAIVFSHICQGFADKAVASGRFYFGKGKILNTSFSKVEIQVAEDFQRYGGTKDTGLKHEAGFDAYMTGAIFAQACHLLQIDAPTIRKLPQAVKAGEPGLASYANLLVMGWVGSMSLDVTTGKEATGVKTLRGTHPPKRGQYEYKRVALLWGFPLGSKEHTLRRTVQRFFHPERLQREGPFPSLDITIVDESSAFIDFKEPQIMHQFLQLMQKPNSPEAEEMISQGLRAAPYEAYQHLCRSPLTTERLVDSANILRLDNYSEEISSIVELSPSERNEDADSVYVSEPRSDEQVVVVEKGGALPSQGTEISGEKVENRFGPGSTLEQHRPREAEAFSSIDRNSLELSYSSWMKRSFREEQPTMGGPSVIKRSRTQDPGDGSES